LTEVVEEERDRLRGEGARDVARAVAAHPVRDDKEIELRLDEDVVLVDLPRLADVGHAGSDEPCRTARHFLRHSAADYNVRFPVFAHQITSLL
jgi:hypothetical protein